MAGGGGAQNSEGHQKGAPRGCRGYFGAQLQKVERCQPIQGKGRRAIDGPDRERGHLHKPRGQTESMLS